MDIAQVSQSFQVVIPPTVRKAIGLRRGQKVQVIPYAGRIEIVPLRSASEMRGSLKGIDTTVEREPDRV